MISRDSALTTPMLCVVLLAVGLPLTIAYGASGCQQEQNCRLPDCFCPTFEHPLGSNNVPQMVYFGFDDAVQAQVSGYYDELFTSDRRNQNGCPITMTLYVSHQYTNYDKVAEYYKRGMEIGVHSVTHTDIDTAAKLQEEANQQKQNIVNNAGVPASQVAGWRSPNLKTAGDDQPRILGELDYLYDISLTYSRDANVPWPFTLDYGYPYPCMISPCPSGTNPHKGFWEVMVHSLQNPRTGFPCGYVDGCRPEGESDAEEYLWSNFLHSYETNRAPFGLNMHAAWFATPEYMTAMGKFIDRLLTTPDVYIVNVRQMLEWMKNPVPVSEIKNFAPWGCPGVTTPRPTRKPTTRRPTTTTSIPKPTTTAGRRPYWYRQPTKGSLTYPVKGVENTQDTNRTPVDNRGSDSGRVLPWVREHGWRAATSTRSPASSWNSNVNQQNNDGAQCVQDVNCHLPDCLCRSVTPPPHLSTTGTPQIIYLAIGTEVDGNSYASLLQLFSGDRKNPNGCPISGTIFVPSDGNYPPYIQALKSNGVHVALRGGSYEGWFYGDAMRRRVAQVIHSIKPDASSKAGWRGYANLAPNDDVFRTLTEQNIPYDSSIVSGNSDLPWPYTLDFGLGDQCAERPSTCPKGRYPGLWEVPVTPLVVPRSAGHYSGGGVSSSTCAFPDTCPGTINSESFMKELLNRNFMRHYNGNRAPFGINLQDSWFMNTDNQASLRGLFAFLDDALAKHDVAVLSIEQMLDWVASGDNNIMNLKC
ncbi:uncharacterized protein LOC101850596 [Aplysia californica]|uniref:Uncharacterized protein LOC101850596 n=1 Tax=Aplysia californica TaxID=6500 RepID=A0ABM0K2P5_APLCA|nr:uncharacterized protein LOC101850596 [Aplysia californica]